MGQGGRSKAASSRFTLKELAVELHRALLQQGTHHRQVLPGVQGRTFVGYAEAVLHARTVRRADAEDEPPAAGGGGGQGLLGQGRGVPGVGGDDADAELDTAGLHPGEGQGGQGVVAAGRDVGNPEAVEPVVLGPA